MLKKFKLAALLLPALLWLHCNASPRSHSSTEQSTAVVGKTSPSCSCAGAAGAAQSQAKPAQHHALGASAPRTCNYDVTATHIEIGPAEQTSRSRHHPANDNGTDPPPLDISAYPPRLQQTYRTIICQECNQCHSMHDCLYRGFTPEQWRSTLLLLNSINHNLSQDQIYKLYNFFVYHEKRMREKKQKGARPHDHQ